MSNNIKLDTAKLLGFRIAATSANSKAPAGKLGEKKIVTGAKLGQKDL